MNILRIYSGLSAIALAEFSDIVVDADILLLTTGDPQKLRIHLVDGSFLDVFVSVTGRYSYHWERRFTLSSEIFRHDNAPHKRWSHIKTFPKHFHYEREENVIESFISDDPLEAVREALGFVRQRLHEEPRSRSGE